MSDKRLIDTGNRATIDERTTQNFNTGDRVRAMIGNPKDWIWMEGEIVGWWQLGDEERHARVKFPTGDGHSITKTVRPEQMQLARTR